MTTISARVIAHSVSDRGHEVLSVLCRYPRWIHAEGRTHRQLSAGEDEYPWEPRTPSPMEDSNLSRNASSSRAIPVRRLIQDVLDDPAVPIWWGRKQPGMQAYEELDADERQRAKNIWLCALGDAVARAEQLDQVGAHKQIVNRLLEPFSHINVLFTATEWTNFFALRIHPAAEPHICALAEAIRSAQAASTPRLLEPGQWHLPFTVEDDWADVRSIDGMLRLSTARCAHLSYTTTVGGEPLGLAQANRIWEQLLGGDPIHASPAEHQCTPDEHDIEGWLHEWQQGNLVGWRQHRKLLPGECR